ncbi:MAG: hypothetical protein D3923_00480 [Candidatus Electrothrix sp. AR3]|nr:hypothetical protein [Candidatus Electrothrix sp. AR3]
MKKKSGRVSTGIILLLSMMFLLFCFSPAISAGITARYSQPRGTQIKWQITIPESPPAAVIIIQRIPPQTVVLKSSPTYHSHDQATGTVKWLLTNIQPGKISMSMELDKPIMKKGEIHGEITWLMLDSGVLTW